jgi:hypothetical protein
MPLELSESTVELKVPILHWGGFITPTELKLPLEKDFLVAIWISG